MSLAQTARGQVVQTGDNTPLPQPVSQAEIQLSMYNKLAEADYSRGKHYFKRGLYDSALIFFEDVLEGFPDSEWAPWSMHEIILTFERIGYDTDAAEYRRRLIQNYPDSEAAKLYSGATEGGGAAGA